MANARDALGVDIGDSSVKVAYGRRVGDHMVVEDAAILPLAAEEPDGRAAAASRAIRGYLDKRRIRPSAVIGAVSRSVATLRTISLPPARGEEVSRLVRFEAESHVPFPVSTAEISYSQLSSTADETRVLLGGCPRQHVEEVRTILQTAGLSPTELTVSTVAVANCLLTGFPEFRSGVRMVVDVGHQTTELAIIADGEVASSTSLGIGSGELARAVAADLSVEEREALEHLWSQPLRLSADEGLPPEDMPEAREWFKRFYAGLRRAADAPLADRPQVPASQILLLGGLAMMPGLASGISAALSTPVGIVDALSAFDGRARSDGVGASGSALAGAIGLALQGVGLADLVLDLTPQQVFEMARERRARSFWWVVAVAVALLLFGVYGAIIASANAHQRRIEDYQRKLTALSATLDELDMSRLQKRDAILTEILREVDDPKADWLELLAWLSHALPENVRIRAMSMERGRAVVIRGEATTGSAVADTVDILSQGQFFTAVDLKESRVHPQGGVNLYLFTLRCETEESKEGGR